MRTVRWGRAAVVAALVAANLFLLAEIVLPGVAERRIRGRLEDRGTVQRVEVHAFPAIELLWRHADSVEVTLGELRATTGKLGDLLDDAGGVDRVDARAGIVRTARTVLRDARLRKEGDRLTGEARITRADLRGAFPAAFEVTPVGVQDGTLIVRGRLRVVGTVVGVDARIVASAGGVVVQPVGLPFLEGLFEFTVFRDPRVEVETVTAREVAGGYRVKVTGRLT